MQVIVLLDLLDQLDDLLVGPLAGQPVFVLIERIGRCRTARPRSTVRTASSRRTVVVLMARQAESL
ncbi:hypothetical protein [Phaeodactylibacter luteus]|uniref:hypothetical protein n=1 Tax=Phaeodactylibacter luteus TaxID=1564516 RepID=UPI001FEBC615|nr:hypothetical protein [Phaeodactylibacter luteus]